jgi:hypothetical protein
MMLTSLKKLTVFVKRDRMMLMVTNTVSKAQARRMLRAMRLIEICFATFLSAGTIVAHHLSSYCHITI